jgi:hypothetical protein
MYLGLQTIMMKSYLTALLGAALSSTAFSAGAAPSAKVYSPYKGVLCDRKAGFCADEQGISMGLTKEYLGAEAEKKMLEMTRGSNFDASFYTMSDGTTCKSKERICTTGKWTDKVHTKATMALFGKLPATAKPSKAISFPSAGVMCDKASGFCADSQGISMGLTREYLGASAEAKMLKLVNEGMTTTAYVTSNGVDCDHARKVCMAERRGTEVERRYTKQLFGG